MQRGIDYKVGEFKPRKKQTQNGWICRTWIETSENGWTSEFDRFDTEEEAREHGYTHNRLIKQDELSREFEVYKDFTDPF